VTVAAAAAADAAAAAALLLLLLLLLLRGLFVGSLSIRSPPLVPLPVRVLAHDRCNTDS
jgi:hypothetical protein